MGARSSRSSDAATSKIRLRVSKKSRFNTSEASRSLPIVETPKVQSCPTIETRNSSQTRQTPHVFQFPKRSSTTHRFSQIDAPNAIARARSFPGAKNSLASDSDPLGFKNIGVHPPGSGKGLGEKSLVPKAPGLYGRNGLSDSSAIELRRGIPRGPTAGFSSTSNCARPIPAVRTGKTAARSGLGSTAQPTQPVQQSRSDSTRARHSN